MTFPFGFDRAVMPAMGPEYYRTYSLIAPVVTHRRPATCQEVRCPRHVNGWKMGFDTTDAAQAKAIKWIRMHSGLSYTTEQVGTKIILTFVAGQNCFDQHTIALEREPFYVVREGDFRGNPRRTQAQRFNADDWIDHFANHQDRLATRMEQG
jgi:hypothetical protein